MNQTTIIDHLKFTIPTSRQIYLQSGDLEPLKQLPFESQRLLPPPRRLCDGFSLSICQQDLEKTTWTTVTNLLRDHLLFLYQSGCSCPGHYSFSSNQCSFFVLHWFVVFIRMNKLNNVPEMSLCLVDVTNVLTGFQLLLVLRKCLAITESIALPAGYIILNLQYFTNIPREIITCT